MNEPGLTNTNARAARRESPIGNVRKCHFCLHRLAEGMLPVVSPPVWGGPPTLATPTIPPSLVAELIARPNVMQLKEELGTAAGLLFDVKEDRHDFQTVAYG
jgi:molybdopterin-containing oxidoreductase family iron-sulfur binding subunit